MINQVKEALKTVLLVAQRLERRAWVDFVQATNDMQVSNGGSGGGRDGRDGSSSVSQHVAERTQEQELAEERAAGGGGVAGGVVVANNKATAVLPVLPPELWWGGNLSLRHAKPMGGGCPLRKLNGIPDFADERAEDQ